MSILYQGVCRIVLRVRMGRLGIVWKRDVKSLWGWGRINIFRRLGVMRLAMGVRGRGWAILRRGGRSWGGVPWKGKSWLRRHSPGKKITPTISTISHLKYLLIQEPTAVPMSTRTHKITLITVTFSSTKTISGRCSTNTKILQIILSRKAETHGK